MGRSVQAGRPVRVPSSRVPCLARMHRLALALFVLGCGSSPPPTESPSSRVAAPWAEHPEVLRLPVPIEGAAGRGAEHPLVTIVMFSDFECPFCRDAAPLLAHIEGAHPDRIAVHFRHLPMPMHEHAQLAAEAAE